jgi:thiol-disulfide isomerase/thioredoxin
MIKQLSLLAAALLFATSGAAFADKLGVGDAAPKLDVSKWVKGTPVSRFEKGRVYVVEFWATWCAPCRVSIPHLTEMQKNNPNVTFIGVSVWEHAQSDVEPFVEKMGDKMDYRVAMDVVPEGEKAKGKMAETWMEAASQPGIPTAFIVNGDGRIAWIGYPLSMDRPLAKIVAGKWNIETQVLASATQDKVSKAMKAHDGKAALAAIDDAIAKDAAVETVLGGTKFKVLMATKDYAGAYAYGAKLVDGALKDESNELNEMAWMIVDPRAKSLEKRDLDLALKAAKRASELTEGKDPAILDTLAKVHFDMGEISKAVEIQQKAVDAAKDTPMEKDLSERLEEYKKAAEKPKN